MSYYTSFNIRTMKKYEYSLLNLLHPEQGNIHTLKIAEIFTHSSEADGFSAFPFPHGSFMLTILF